MSTLSRIPKPFIAAVLAGVTYVGVKHYLIKQRNASAIPASVPAANNEPVPPSKPVVRTVKPVVPVITTSKGFPLAAGSRGSEVKELQRALGVSADGIFGKQTLAALKAKYNIVSVSKEYYPVIISAGAKEASLKTSQPVKG